jgi:hypothetical protein
MTGMMKKMAWLQRLAEHIHRLFVSKQNTALAWIMVIALTSLLLIGVVSNGGAR